MDVVITIVSSVICFLALAFVVANLENIVDWLNKEDSLFSKLLIKEPEPEPSEREYKEPVTLHWFPGRSLSPDSIVVELGATEIKYVPELYTSAIEGECRECKAPLQDNWGYCPYCGGKIVLRVGPEFPEEE